MMAKRFIYRHPAAVDDDDLIRQCRMVRGRSSGPGGQHRNKVSTAVTYTHTPTGIAASASESRQPERNRKAALHRLRVRLALAHRVSVPLPGYEVSPRMQCRIRNRRLALNAEHHDAPAILAEILDVLTTVNDDLDDAAVLLDLSKTQIIRLLAKFPEALTDLNARRTARGQHPLK